MLNKMKIVLAGAAAVAAMSSSAAFADTKTATATVEVLKAVSITAVSDLDFGVIAASTGGGTVTIGASSAAVPSASGVTYIRGGAAASFKVSQASNGEVIEFSTGNINALTGAGADIPLSGLTLSQSTLTYDSSLALASQPSIYVGGTISLGTNQVAGTYTGSFDVTADYQ
jgi:Mat/Ecp fimbriae major subunit